MPAMRIRDDAELASLSDAELLAYLGLLARRLAAVEAEQATLWAARIAVYKEARWFRDPPMMYGPLSDRAGVTEAAISIKLKQLEERGDRPGVPALA